MARVDIIMPQMGESIAEGTLSKWLKKVGDEVKRDEPIFEISTDKVDAEIPAPAAGVLAEILVKEGETVEVQTVVARLETEKGAAIEKGAQPTAGSGDVSSPPKAEIKAEAKSAAAAPQREPTPAATPVRQQPPAPAIATSHSGNGNSFEERVRTKSSPLVRKIAAEHGVEIDFTRVARIRATKRAEFETATGQKLSYMPFIIRAVTQGLQAFPVMNSSVAGTSIIYRKQINIGVAVALDWGLIVPVIKHADDLSLSGITRALNDLAARARSKKLSPEEVQEGTFTITNPGVFGSLMGTPIINQPQVAILGVGAIEKRPKILTGADGEDTIAIRTCAYFSISFDHRVIDGAVADQFLAFVKKTIESFPETGL